MNMSASLATDEDWLIISSSSDIDEESQVGSGHASEAENAPRVSTDNATIDNAADTTDDADKIVPDVSETNVSDVPDSSVNTLKGHSAVLSSPETPDSGVGDATVEDSEKSLESSVTPESKPDEIGDEESSLNEQNQQESALVDSPTLTASDPAPKTSSTTPSPPPSCCSFSFCRALSVIDSKIRSASRLLYRALFADSFSALDKKRRDVPLDISLFQHARYSLLSVLNRNQDLLLYYAMALAVSVLSVAAFRPSTPKHEPSLGEKLNALWTEFVYEETVSEKPHYFLFARADIPKRQLKIVKVWNNAVESAPEVWAESSEVTKRFLEDSSEVTKRFLEDSSDLTKRFLVGSAAWSRSLWEELRNHPNTQHLKTMLETAKDKTLVFGNEQALPFMRKAASQGRSHAEAWASYSTDVAKVWAKQADLVSREMQQRATLLWKQAVEEAPAMKEALDATSRDLYKRSVCMLEQLRMLCEQ